MKLVFDIETVGCDFEDLDESQQEYLLRYAQKERDPEAKREKEEEAIRYLSLYPFTAAVVTIAMFNVDTGKTLVLYNDSGEEERIFDEKSIKYKSLSEKEMLKTFWSYAKQSKQIISFNGKQFDIPFLMLRSAMNKIKPTKNYIKNRYETKEHIDLIDKFTFMGLTRKFNLDFYCKSFGIKSPKASGITGMDIKELYRSGKVKEIAIYCADDVRATYELYKYWQRYLNIT